MRKTVSVLLAVIIILGMAAPAFANTAPAGQTVQLPEQYGIEPMAGAYPNETGYDLWLRYRRITDSYYSYEVASTLNYVLESSEFTSEEVIASSLKELQRGLKGMTNRDVTLKAAAEADGAVIMGTFENPVVSSILGSSLAEGLGKDGYIIKSAEYNGKKVTVIAGGGPNGVLYGTFKLLELIQCREDITALDYSDAPKIQWRVLNQWDNWDRSIERGYAGSSIYKWSELPDIVDERYEDFARANASVGINTIVINNVNTQVEFIQTRNLPKVAKIADIFRKYGIRLALSVRFDSPQAIGGNDKSPQIGTSDPLENAVKEWWKGKFIEIYSYIPDFAGVLVKADSESRKGPYDYGRDHADGANMFSDILKTHNDAVVMWRAFVYGPAASSLSSDIVNQSYEFFKPLDNKFNDNVVVQSKNGPRDFLPIEPVHPLFGGMTKTNMGIELQITQEYTGQSTHLCYLVPMWKTYFDTDMMVEEGVVDSSEGTTLAKIVDGTVFNRTNSLVAGVSNVGEDTNWNRLEFAQANWYGFGKLAWNPQTPEEDITKTWIKMTFNNDDEVVNTIRGIFLDSWGIYRSYIMPYAMGMTCDSSVHYNPNLDGRNSSGFLKVDGDGNGHPRNSKSTGNNTDSTAQYSAKLGAIYDNIETCPEELLSWFHHVPYTRTMSNGKTMVDNLYEGFQTAPEKIKDMRLRFLTLSDKIDDARVSRIAASFDEQHKDSLRWRNAMIAFFDKYSGKEEHNFKNVALGKTVIASQYYNKYYPSYITDGSTSPNDNRWATERNDDSQYIFIDLVTPTNINRVDIYWENFSTIYEIDVADALTNPNGSVESDWERVGVFFGGEWNKIPFGAAQTSVMFEEVTARYVRMRTIEKNSGLWNSIYQFEIYGDDFEETARYTLKRELAKAQVFNLNCTSESAKRLQDAIENAKTLIDDEHSAGADMLAGINELKASCNEMKFDDLAVRKKARRNTVANAYHAGNAIDGQSGTFWQAANSNTALAELKIDMRKDEAFDTIIIKWKSAAPEYKLEYATSEEPDVWKELKKVDRTGVTGSVDTIKLDALLTAQHVRLQSVSRLNELSIYNFEIYDDSGSQDKSRTDLEEVINSAKTIYTENELEKYTEESVAAYQEALAEAENALADENADTQKLRNAKKALEEAIENLILHENSTDKYELISSIKKAEKLNENDFTPESWENLEDALAKAKLVVNTPSASQAAVNEAAEQLDEAMRSLEAKEGPVVSADTMAIRSGKTDSFMVWFGNDSELESASITVEDADIASVSTDELDGDGEVTVTGEEVGKTKITVTFNGGDWDGTTHEIKVEVLEPVKEIQVTFDTQGGEPQPQPVVAIEGEQYPVLPYVSKSGYVFEGWFTQPEGGVQVKGGDIAVQNGDHTLYARWTASQTIPSSGSRDNDSGTNIADTDRNITIQEREVPLAGSPVITALTEKEAEELFKKALSAKAQDQGNIIIRVINVKTIPLNVMQRLAKLAEESKVKITIHADTAVNKKVVGRLYINPETATKDINTTVETGSKKALNTLKMFQKYFKNNIKVIELDQQCVRQVKMLAKGPQKG